MSHYFENDKNLKSEMQERQIHMFDQTYSFMTDHGVFSKEGLDFGTRSLLETLPWKEIHGQVLDLGCGYGPIGIIVQERTKAEVDMIDVNLRSLHLARMNVTKNKVTAQVFESDGYEHIDKKYDYIITNPPIRVGKKILYRLLFEAKEHLTPEGELWLVINKAQGAKSLVKDLEKEYQTEVVRKNKGFYIIRAVGGIKS